MFYRYHGIRRRDQNPSGKWMQIPKAGVASVISESDGVWQIDVSRRRVGATIRRDVFSVSVRSDTPVQEDYLTGFSSKEAALEAGRNRAAAMQLKRDRALSRGKLNSW